MTALTSIPELIKSESSEEIKRTSNQGYIQNSRDSSNDYSELIPKIIGVTGIALSGISLLSIPYRLDRLYNPLNNQL
ncbi:hypothetical protein AUJ64_04145 [Candidatus Pacearchaeota archaeon CG1_02_39_14]|nr:MAG: hypothetical protein AUJ64_04145 [Candidatus Pacearchaeota archaeon CG1_02_39_14]